METEPQTEQRSKRTIWIAVACLFVGLVVFALVGLEHGEPSIRGHSLTAWIEKSMRSTLGSPAQVEARQAILDLGADAVPYLLFCIEGKQTSKDKVADYLISKGYMNAAFWLIGTQHFERRQIYAIHGFEVLGTNALSALPELVKLVDRPRDPSTNRVIVRVASGAAMSLALLGREGQLEVLRRFHEPGKFRLHAMPVNGVFALSRLKQFEPEVLNAVYRYATNSDLDDRRFALTAVRNLEGNLDLKRILLDWVLKSGLDYEYENALVVLEATPELIPEFRVRLAALGPLKNLEAAKIQSRLLALPQSTPK